MMHPKNICFEMLSIVILNIVILRIYRYYSQYYPQHMGTNKTVVHSMLTPSVILNYNYAFKSDYSDIVSTLAKHTDLKEKIENLPNRFRDIIGDICLLPDDGSKRISSLKVGTTAVASDGSYYKDMKKGTHAYILVFIDSDEGQIKGSATSPHSNHMSLAPTEHYGALAVIITLIVLLYHHNEDGLGWPKITIYIDNEEIVLDRGNTCKPKFQNAQQYLAHDYDLWMATSVLLRGLHLAVEFEWVRGHQDVTDQTNDNIMVTLLNIEVDKMATEQYNKLEFPPHRGALLSLARFSCTKNIKNAIFLEQNSISRQKSCKFLKMCRVVVQRGNHYKHNLYIN
jgi:hypothetical protein